jgi:hypothetical protein
VQLLLEEEAINANVHGGLYGSGLHEAASHDHDRIVWLLPESGGKVKHKEGEAMQVRCRLRRQVHHSPVAGKGRGENAN